MVVFSFAALILHTFNQKCPSNNVKFDPIVIWSIYIIVAVGIKPTGKDDDIPTVQDDIELFKWIENSHWSKVFIIFLYQGLPSFLLSLIITCECIKQNSGLKHVLEIQRNKLLKFQTFITIAPFQLAKFSFHYFITLSVLINLSGHMILAL